MQIDIYLRVGSIVFLDDGSGAAVAGDTVLLSLNQLVVVTKVNVSSCS